MDVFRDIFNVFFCSGMEREEASEEVAEGSVQLKAEGGGVSEEEARGQATKYFISGPKFPPS